MIMPLSLLHNLKHKASNLAYNSPFYNWSLNESAPDRLVVKPVDPWPGNAEMGKELLQAAGVGDRTGPQWYEEWWSPENVDDIWRNHMHGFGWLRDLRTLDGAVAREQGRLMIESWITRHGNWHANSWKPYLIGRRLAMWICHYEFFCANADDEFEDKMLASIVKQAKHLSNTLCATKSLECVKGLLYAGIALEGYERWIEQSLKTLEKMLQQNILADGGHVSRSPAKLLNTIEILVDIRTALNAGAYPLPDFITDTITNMSSTLRLFRHRDRQLALFHGAQGGDATFIDSVLAQAGAQKRAKNSLEQTGFERIEVGKGLLIMDTGKAPFAPHDKTAHASPLAFEFSFGKDRLLSSCGSHPTSKDWKDALRFTAAHNTACLDYRNACEIKQDGHFGRRVTQCTVHREETKDAALLIASHNGYVPLNGITHTRKIYLADGGEDLRGQDDLACSFALAHPVETAIRFHIHPSVTASLINDDQNVLLRMPGGIGWRFKCSAGVLALEDSLYLGSGITPRKTKQIVIYGRMTESDARVKWSFKREH
ncbi:MAG: heparinase [Alphaproteobacteria bacterium]|nr:heparinase [Alphaproteobacteria bacterium]